MEAIVLNTDLEAVGVIDRYKSFIWTDRFQECGDFEICLLAKYGLPEFIQEDHYLVCDKSEHAMIIETIRIDSDPEDGTTFLISGRSLESLLDRRIVWTKTSFEATQSKDASTGEITLTKPNLQNGVEKLLNDSIINPTMAIRKIDNFIFEKSEDEKVTSLVFEAQYFGDELYSAIVKLCQEHDIGFKVTINANNQFVFKLYAGVDRSYGTEDKPQTVNPYIIFSPEFDNVMNTNYLESNSGFKNVTLVGGESETDDNGEEISRDTYVVSLAELSSGISRREIFTDAGSVTRNADQDTNLTEEQYQAHLRKAGIDTLIECARIRAFDGEIDPNSMYVYGEDYAIGDVVQIANEYGQEGQAYISEYIMSCDEQGISAYPTFITIQRGEYDTE